MIKTLLFSFGTSVLFLLSCYTDNTIEVCQLPPHEDCQNYIIFGRLRQDSCQRDCREFFLLTEYRIYRAAPDQYERLERTYFTPLPMERGHFQYAAPLFSPPRELISPKLRPRFVHDPKNDADYYWQYQRGGQRFAIRFDATDISVPQSVRTYMEQLRMVTDSLR